MFQQLLTLQMSHAKCVCREAHRFVIPVASTQLLCGLTPLLRQQISPWSQWLTPGMSVSNFSGSLFQPKEMFGVTLPFKKKM
jgi:hypothetical protein